jgi:hypothetical protein
MSRNRLFAWFESVKRTKQSVRVLFSDHLVANCKSRNVLAASSPPLKTDRMLEPVRWDVEKRVRKDVKNAMP